MKVVNAAELKNVLNQAQDDPLHEGRKRRKLLIVFLKNHIGGSMTSLINFLHTIDPEQYEVDLLFRTIVDGMPKLPSHVHVLEPAALERSTQNASAALKLVVNPLYQLSKLWLRVCEHFGTNTLPAIQLQMQQSVCFSRKLEKKYDIALAYEMNWCMYYTAKFVQARRKIVLFHNDYHEIGYDFRLDRPYFQQMDALGFVSKECKQKFIERHPECAKKACFIPNLTAAEPLIERSKAEMEKPAPARKEGVLHLLSISRISFDAKGIDRMIPVCVRLREEGLLEKFHWTVIGGGDDLKTFLRMIDENHLGEHVCSLGKILNPMPYLPLYDGILLPSRNEGRPMVVTEAQIMGVPPVVTHYASSVEQIDSGVDGLIMDNNDEALYQGIKDLILHPEKLSEMRKVVTSRRYSNEEDIAYFYQVVDKLLA